MKRRIDSGIAQSLLYVSSGTRGRINYFRNSVGLLTKIRPVRARFCADMNRTSTFGIFERCLQTQRIFCLSSFSLQIASHCSGVFGFGTKPFSDGNDFSGTAEFLSGFEHAVFDPFDQNDHFFKVFLSFGRQDRPSNKALWSAFRDQKRRRKYRQFRRLSGFC